MKLEVEEIKKIIPHRYPFLLIDRVTEMEPGKRAVGIKNVTVNEHYFQGHFPDFPIMPGVLMVEALAQLGAVSLLSLPENKGKIALFAGIEKVRFKKPVFPGDTLELSIEITASRGDIGKGAGMVKVDGQVAVTGELIFMLTVNDNSAEG